SAACGIIPAGTASIIAGCKESPATVRTVDVTPPVITCPAPITVAACNGAVPAPDITLVTATDGCGTPVITFVNDAVNLSGCTETTTRTYKATDACGNTATCAQTITRTVDVTPPVI